MEKYKIHSIIFVIAVFVSLLLFYTAFDKKTQSIVPQKLIDVVSFKDVSGSLRELNKVAALAAIGLISFVFIVGPLSKMFPLVFARFLQWRKPVGLIGFGFAVLHAVYSLIFIYGLDLDKTVFSNPNILGVASGVIALIIFFLMGMTSTKEAVEKMGYIRWKMLQTTGYVALFFSIVHFIVLETKPEKGFDVRPFGVLFLLLAIAALALRIGTVIIRTRPRESFHEHIGAEPPKKQ